MTNTKAFAWIVLGIVISLTLPVLATQVKQIFPRADLHGVNPEASLPSLWQQAKPFVVTSIFAVLTALLILASIVRSGGKINSWADAMLYGFAWDSVLQKLLNG